MEIKIDNEIRNLIPPLTDEELTGLEEDIRKHGCLDPLVIWRENGILVDGHHRYQICTTSEPPLDFNQTSISLPNREEALLWVINHQLGRRNLSKEQKSELRGAKYHFTKLIEGARKLRAKEAAKKQAQPRDSTTGRLIPKPQQEESPDGGKIYHEQENTSGKTAKEIAKSENVSDKTVRNDEQFYEAMKWLKENHAEFAKNVLKGDGAIKKGDWEDFADMDDGDKAVAFEGFRLGKSLKVQQKERDEVQKEQSRANVQDIAPEIIASHGGVEAFAGREEGRTTDENDIPVTVGDGEEVSADEAYRTLIQGEERKASLKERVELAISVLGESGFSVQEIESVFNEVISEAKTKGGDWWKLRKNLSSEDIPGVSTRLE